MRLIVALAVILCIAHGTNSQGLFGNLAKGASDIFGSIFGGGNGKNQQDPCTKGIDVDYKNAQEHFYKNLYAKLAARSDNHFVFSPYTIWLSLSALAEGADPTQRKDLFASLLVPQEKCRRQKFYEIALNVEQPGRDVNLQRRRSLILDEDLLINPDWAKLVKNSGLLDVAVAPIKTDPEATSKRLQEFLATRSTIPIEGNSILLDSLDYHGLWTTAFADAAIQQAPFYNDLGEQIGTVDMMRMKKRVRLAHVPFMTTKILELPVGINGRYTMLIAVGTGNDIIKNAIEIFLGSIFEIFSALQMSLVPIDIAVPKFMMSSEFDARPALEDIGINRFWKDPSATSYVTHPAALPTALIQRVTVTVDGRGVQPAPAGPDNIISGLVNLASDTMTGMVSAVGHNFIANRPFMYALFDTKTRTCLFAGAFSRPNSA